MISRSRDFALMMITAAGAAALFWLLRDHWRHALGVAPYLLFLACPIMHLFMHHGRYRNHGQARQASAGDRAPPVG